MPGTTIRVLIVDDVAESRDNVEKLLRFEPDIQVVGKASRGQEGIDLAASLHPDVVLMDLHMPDMDGIEATMQLTTKVPATSVIMMSVQNEPDVLRRAMLAGAREFLSKPFSLDELITSVRHVAKLVRPVQVVNGAPAATANGTRPAETGRGRLICVCSSKGGVGRSFVAANLAVALRRATGKNVALVDAALHFGDIGVMMNVADGKTIADIVPQARSLDRELMDDVLVTHTSGVRLLLAPPTPQDAEIVAADHLRAAIGLLGRMTDYVVVDTRPGFDDSMLGIMDASDVILLVLTMEMTAIKDTRQFLEITELLGYPMSKIQLVLNRANTYSGIPVQDIAENLKREIPFRLPEDASAVLRSINEGSPLVDHQPDHRVSAELTRLASTLIGADAEAEQVGAGASTDRSLGRFGWLRSSLRHA